MKHKEYLNYKFYIFGCTTCIKYTLSNKYKLVKNWWQNWCTSWAGFTVL